MTAIVVVVLGFVSGDVDNDALLWRNTHVSKWCEGDACLKNAQAKPMQLSYSQRERGNEPPPTETEIEPIDLNRHSVARKQDC